MWKVEIIGEAYTKYTISFIKSIKANTLISMFLFYHSSIYLVVVSTLLYTLNI